MNAKEFKIEVLPVSNKLLRFAIQFLKNDNEAKDVVQDVFLKLWQKRDELGKVENIEAFAMRMVRNRCLDLFRTNRSTFIEDQKGNLLENKTTDLSLEMDISESARLVRKVIKELPELQQKVMWLRDIEQYEFEEIAAITDLNDNAIRVNLSRARKKVRDELLKHHNYGIEGSKTTIEKIL